MNTPIASTPVYIDKGDGKMGERIDRGGHLIIGGFLGLLALWFGGIYMLQQVGWLNSF